MTQSQEQPEQMDLSTALWLACDILPATNIDRAAKVLARKVWELEKELGREPTSAVVSDKDMGR